MNGIGYKSSPNYNAHQTASSDKIKLLKFRSLVFCSLMGATSAICEQLLFQLYTNKQTMSKHGRHTVQTSGYFTPFLHGSNDDVQRKSIVFPSTMTTTTTWVSVLRWVVVQVTKANTAKVYRFSSNLVIFWRHNTKLCAQWNLCTQVKWIFYGI